MASPTKRSRTDAKEDGEQIYTVGLRHNGVVAPIEVLTAPNVSEVTCSLDAFVSLRQLLQGKAPADIVRPELGNEVLDTATRIGCRQALRKQMLRLRDNIEVTKYVLFYSKLDHIHVMRDRFEAADSPLLAALSGRSYSDLFLRGEAFITDTGAVTVDVTNYRMRDSLSTRTALCAMFRGLETGTFTEPAKEMAFRLAVQLPDLTSTKAPVQLSSDAFYEIKVRNDLFRGNHTSWVLWPKRLVDALPQAAALTSRATVHSAERVSADCTDLYLSATCLTVLRHFLDTRQEQSQYERRNALSAMAGLGVADPERFYQSVLLQG